MASPWRKLSAEVKLPGKSFESVSLPPCLPENESFLRSAYILTKSLVNTASSSNANNKQWLDGIRRNVVICRFVPKWKETVVLRMREIHWSRANQSRTQSLGCRTRMPNEIRGSGRVQWPDTTKSWYPVLLHVSEWQNGERRVVQKCALWNTGWKTSERRRFVWKRNSTKHYEEYLSVGKPVATRKQIHALTWSRDLVPMSWFELIVSVCVFTLLFLFVCSPYCFCLCVHLTVSVCVFTLLFLFVCSPLVSVCVLTFSFCLCVDL